MESLLDDMEALVAPDLTADAPDWCSNCRTLRQEIQKLQDEHIQNFGKLKQKIISTDLLIKKYKSKCDDYELQYKRTEETTKKAEKFQRQSEILEAQLTAALLDTEPLRTSKASLEAELANKTKENQILSDKLKYAQSTNEQYLHLSKQSSADVERLEGEKRALKATIKELESGKPKGNDVKQYKGEISVLKKEKKALQKNTTILEKRLAAALRQVEALKTKMKTTYGSPYRGRRSESSPVKSPNRNSSTGHNLPIHSPLGRSPPIGRQRRTNSGRSPGSTPKKQSEPPEDAGDHKAAPIKDDSSDSDSDANSSLSGFSLSFTSCLKCLSPLPPSPACFHMQKVGDEGSGAMDTDDDDGLSDAAEMLEKDLLEHDQEVNNDTELGSNSNVTVPFSKTCGDTVEEKDGSENSKADKRKIKHNRTKNKSSGSVKAKMTQDASNKTNEKAKVETVDKPENVTDVSHEEKEEKVLNELKYSVGSRLNDETKSNDLENIAETRDIKSDKPFTRGDTEEFIPLIKDETVGARLESVSEDQKEGSFVGNVAIETCKDSVTDAKDSVAGDRMANDDDDGFDLEKECAFVDEAGSFDRNDEKIEKPDAIDTANDYNAEKLSVGATRSIKSSDKNVVESVASDNGTCDGKTNDNLGDISRLSEKREGTHEIIWDKTGNEHLKHRTSHPDKNKAKKSSTVISNEQSNEDCTKMAEHKAVKDVTENLSPKIENKNPGHFDERNLREPNDANTCSNVKSDVKGNRRAANNIWSDIQAVDTVSEIVDELGTVADDFDGIEGYRILERGTKITPDIPSPEKNNQIQNKKLKVIRHKIRRKCKWADKEYESGNKQSKHVKSFEDEIAELQNRRKGKSGSSDSSDNRNTSVDRDRIDNDRISDTKATMSSKEAAESEDQLKGKTKKMNTNTDNHSDAADDAKDNDIDSGSETGEKGPPPSRQLSTGFIVNSGKVERTHSTDSSHSIKFSPRNSPIRMNNFDTTPCDTIQEEKMDELIKIGTIGKCNLRAGKDQTDSVFGVQDLQSDIEQDDIVEDEVNALGTNVVPKFDKSIDAEYADVADLDKANSDEMNSHRERENDSKGAVNELKNNLNEIERSVEKQKTKGSKVVNDGAIPGCSHFLDDKASEISKASRAHLKLPLNESRTASGTSSPSVDSIDCASPLSPLCLSPFCFLNPISPLPPSPVKEIDRVTPLSPEFEQSTHQGHLVAGHNAVGDEEDNSEEFVEQNDDVVESEQEIKAVDNQTENKPPDLNSDGGSNVGKKDGEKKDDGDNGNAIKVESKSMNNETLEDNKIDQLDLCNKNISNNNQNSNSVYRKTKFKTSRNKTGVNEKQKKQNGAKSHRDDDVVIKAEKQNLNTNSAPADVNVKPKANVDNRTDTSESDTDKLRFSPVPEMISPLKTPKKKRVSKETTGASNIGIDLTKQFIPKTKAKRPNTLLGMKDTVTHKVDNDSKEETGSKAETEGIKVSKPVMFVSEAPVDAVKVPPQSARKVPTQNVLKKPTECTNKGRTSKEITGDSGKSSQSTVQTKNTPDKSSDTKEAQRKVCRDGKRNETKTVRRRSNISKAIKRASSCTIKTVVSKGAKVEAENYSSEQEKGDGNNASETKKSSDLSETKEENRETSEMTKVSGDVVADDEMITTPSDTALQPVDEVINGQDNWAFKRKARLAHRPNIQSLKPAKIQLIDEVVLPVPLAITKKRRRIDLLTKPGQMKKMCQTRAARTTRQQQTSGQKSQHDLVKKLQSFLKCSDTAESFVTMVTPELEQETAGQELLKACIEYIGRLQFDGLDAVYSTCLGPDLASLGSNHSFLSETERKLLDLLLCLINDDSLNVPVSMVLQELWDMVVAASISDQIQPTYGRLTACRLFTGLCANKGDIETVRVLLHKLVTCCPVQCSHFLVPVVSVWPETLRKNPDDRPDVMVSHSMVLVLEDVMTGELMKENTDYSNKVLFILQKLCGWNAGQGNTDIILKVLLTRLSDICTGESDAGLWFETIKAMELLLSRQTWKFCKDMFVNRHGLQSAVNKYLATKINIPVHPDYMCAVLKLTSYMIQQHHGQLNNKAYSQIVKTWLIPVLSHKSGDGKVQQQCLQTLIEISPYYPFILTNIKHWYDTTQPDILDTTLAQLEDLRCRYKNKFKFDCNPFNR